MLQILKPIILQIFFGCILFVWTSVTAKAATDKLDLLRVCYFTKGSVTPQSLNVTLCTHIIAGFSSVKDGILYIGSAEQEEFYHETTSLKKSYPDLKVLITVGGGGNDDGFSDMVASLSSRTRFIASALAVLWSYNFDGLDLDWEFPSWNSGSAAEKENFIAFLQEFRTLSTIYTKTTNSKSYLLTVAVAGPKSIIDISYDVPAMAKYVDFINLMSYDFHDYFWYTPFTDHNSPLFQRESEEDYFATLNTNFSANYWNTLGMPKNKIMVGIPTYAHTFILLDPEMHNVTAPATGTIGDLTYTDVCKLLTSGGSRVFDEESRVPYAYKGNLWVSYEDTESIAGKAKWIKSSGFGGAMTYNLNSDDYTQACDKSLYPLHRTLYQVFTS